MKINLGKIEPDTCELLLYAERPFPYFVPIPILGAGTGEAEALSSYICRLAELSSELTRPYTRKLLKEYLSKEEQPKDQSIPSTGLHPCNAIGKMEQRFSKAISTASNGKVDPRLMTLRPIEFLTDKKNHSLTKDTMYWCPKCWEEDVDNGRTPYMRLYWIFQHTRTCAKHNQRLLDVCPLCLEQQALFPTFPLQHICDRCGHELYKTTKRYKPDNFTKEESWLSHNNFSLIERLSSRAYKVNENTLPIALKRILQTFSMSTKELSNLMKVDHRMITGIIDKTRRPYFPALLDMCYRMDIPTDCLLFDKDILTNPENWRNHSQTHHVTMSKLSSAKKQRIYEDMIKAVRSNKKPPPRVSHIASKFSVQNSTLRMNFPREYSILTSRRSKWEKEFRKNQHQSRIETLIRSIFSLVKVGVYPSERKLRDLGYLTPSDFRREDIRHLLSAFQDIYKAHGFLDD